jgi:Transposase IS116/IS110/IS902 family
VTRAAFATARAMVKHAGLVPREKLSGTFVGRTKLTGQGRPLLRLAAWRAVWGALKANPVYAARYRHLTTRERNKLKPTQAQTVMGAAVLRQLHAVITTGRAWDPTSPCTEPDTAGSRLSRPNNASSRPASSGRSGRALRGIETPRDLDAHHGQPRPSSPQPDYTLLGTAPSPLCRDRRRARHRQTLDANRLTLM